MSYRVRERFLSPLVDFSSLSADWLPVPHVTTLLAPGHIRSVSELQVSGLNILPMVLTY